MPRRKKASPNSQAGSSGTFFFLGLPIPAKGVHISDPKAIPEYRYKPLKGTHPIRLIALQPGKGSASDLKCDIIHTDVGVGEQKGRPCYTALSYHWGSPERTHLLHCGASKIKITASLHTALRY